VRAGHYVRFHPADVEVLDRRPAGGKRQWEATVTDVPRDPFAHTDALYNRALHGGLLLRALLDTDMRVVVHRLMDTLGRGDLEDVVLMVLLSGHAPEWTHLAAQGLPPLAGEAGSAT
jgi:hypothetical protein